jgi:molybdopterin-guanine dinucleotide biosynthesis protein B
MRLFGLAAWSGSGKTTLLVRLIPALVARGLTVSTIKRAHHDFDIDQPGKDSWRHREAGATEVLIGSSRRWALQHELRGAPEPTLDELLSHLSPVDLVLVEGFKRDPHPKLEIVRPSLGKPLLHHEDPWIRALAAVEPLPAALRETCRLPVYEADDVEGIARFVVEAAAPWEGGR